MIIIHASASDGRLVLWGEATPVPPAKGTRKAARRTVAARLLPSRFALEDDRLIEAVAAGVSGFEISGERRQRRVVWLPSNDHGALPSSPLLTEGTEEPGAVR